MVDYIWEAARVNSNSVSADNVRRLIIETAAECGEAAHIGGSLSMVELLNVLFGSVLRHRPAEPDWPDRDVFMSLHMMSCSSRLFLSLLGPFFRSI